MTQARWACLLTLLTTALCNISCGDDAETPPSGSAGSTTAGTGGGGAGSGGTNGSVSGSAGAGSGGSGNTSGSGGNAGNGGSAGSATAGTGGGGSARIFTVRPDFCTPRCQDSGGYCALVDRGGCGSGAKPCVVEAECRPYTACALADATCGPGKCIDNTDDACTVVGCPGHCFCNVKSCPEGQAFDENAAVCACVPTTMPPLDCPDIDCPDGTDCEIVLGSAVCTKRFSG